MVLVLAVGGVGVILGPGKPGSGGDSVSAKSRDIDGDGLPNDVEDAGWFTGDASYRTDPRKADTDGDGLVDGDEAGDLVGKAGATNVYAGHSNPLAADTDKDSLDDLAEADLGLDPFIGDTDDDGIKDGREADVVGSDPGLADTDGDGFDDGYEDAKRNSQGLDPLVVDVKISKASYISDYAKGAVAGDLWREDSLAWFAGNLTSGASSSIPVIGSLVGAIADVRDVIGSAIHADWVGSGFSAVGALPGGDVVAMPGKAAKFVARSPELAAAAASVVASMSKVPTAIKVKASKKLWKDWDVLRSAGASDKTLLRLERGTTDLHRLAEAVKRPTHVPGPKAKFFADGRAGERWLEDLLGVDTKGATKQVSALTSDCIEVCNLDRRVFDVLADGVAHEAKVGYRRWSESLAKQIRSDAYLIKHGDIEGAHWHFLASSYNNRLGADPKVLDLLDELEIPYTIHFPA